VREITYMGKLNKVHFSSNSNEWATPFELFKRIEGICGKFDLDPCCTALNAKCHTYFTKEDDGLSQPWGARRVFVNPPYGREIGKWIRKAWQEWYKRGTRVVCLIPSRTDTKWWHEYCMDATKIIFIEGRIKFELDGKKMFPAPFPSCLVIFEEEFLDKFPEIGRMDA
jgi:phage N-6-adenine-methyltransferase